MKKYLLPVTGVATGVLVASAALAQQNAPMPTPIVEIFACNFNENSDRADVDAAAARFNTWADRNNVSDYGAFIATPWVYSPDLPYDLLWLGAWPNGTAMGKGEALYMSQGREVAAAFDTAVDCPTHSLYAEVIIKAPEGPAPQNPVAVFRDCTVREGRTVPEAIEALGDWSEYLAGQGANPFSAILFGLGGLPDADDYTFKSVEGFDSLETLGQFLDLYTGGGFLRGEEIFGRLLECDSPRIYTLTRVRASAGPN
jgi:hypothetical protein